MFQGCRSLGFLLFVPLASCGLVATYYPPPTVQPAPRDPTRVDATFDQTWSEAVAVLAERNIPIATIDKASGLIASERVTLATASPEWTNCGRAGEMVLTADYARFTILVRTVDQHTSSIHLTANFEYDAPPAYGIVTCISRGVWEAEAEAAVKKAAEGGDGPG